MLGLGLTTIGLKFDLENSDIRHVGGGIHVSTENIYLNIRIDRFKDWRSQILITNIEFRYFFEIFLFNLKFGFFKIICFFDYFLGGWFMIWFLSFFIDFSNFFNATSFFSFFGFLSRRFCIFCDISDNLTFIE